MIIFQTAKIGVGCLLLINALVSTGELKEIEEYDVDFDHQFLETEKYDAKPTYKSSSATDLAYMSSVT